MGSEKFCVCGHREKSHEYEVTMTVDVGGEKATWNIHSCGEVAKVSKSGAKLKCHCRSFQPTPFLTKAQMEDQ